MCSMDNPIVIPLLFGVTESTEKLTINDASIIKIGHSNPYRNPNPNRKTTLSSSVVMSLRRGDMGFLEGEYWVDLMIGTIPDSFTNIP